ncbi:DUF305 domain-containing protein [Saccharopolyspora spinosa]|uniref:Uncharacterized protein (DUF305 family) n=1 Tax=Saccharopolyspora spinosa TaxID=60894 RepID=A0A2N3Y7J8_SACSN|nr:DUF305 domain-containing protein [Saccharopolyspora spinosa]PKW18841.1 uncharacterized protein (DUF305 family) [Saccharopolyspora spinosa]
MKRTRVLTAAIGAVAAAAVLAGCGGGDDMSNMPGHGAPTSASQPGATQQAANNAADVTFAQGMIPHHEQAIEMSRLAPERAQSEEVKNLARQIEAAQGPEIQTLTGWLRDWGAPASMPGMDHGAVGHGHMDGMMSDTEMQQLEQARGAEFDRQFLTLMIKHHEGAVAMSQTELASGQFPAAKQMAQQIIDTQRAEIETMRGLLSQG